MRRFFYLSLAILTLLFFNIVTLYAGQFSDAITDSGLVLSSVRTDNSVNQVNLGMPCPWVGEIRGFAYGLNIDENNNSFELLYYNSHLQRNQSAVYKSYIMRDNQIVGKLSGSTYWVDVTTEDTGIMTTSHEYSFAGIFETGKYGRELQGTFLVKSIRTLNNETATCNIKYSYTAALTNPLVSEPLPASPSLTNTLSGIIREFTAAKSQNSIRVKERTTGGCRAGTRNFC